MIVSDRSGLSRDRLRELLDAVVDADNSDVAEMARSSFTSEFHFSRQVSGLAGEPPAAIRRRVMLERAAWRLQRGERVAAVAADEGWSAAHRRELARAMLAPHGVVPGRGDPLDWMRGN